MKTFIVSLLFIAATLLPILFFPLLALSIVILFVLIPYFSDHDIWPHANKGNFKHT